MAYYFSIYKLDEDFVDYEFGLNEAGLIQIIAF